MLILTRNQKQCNVNNYDKPQMLTKIAVELVSFLQPSSNHPSDVVKSHNHHSGSFSQLSQLWKFVPQITQQKQKPKCRQILTVHFI